MNQVVTVPGMSNREFLERYAKTGCIGLCGGDVLIDRAIRRAQRHICDGEWSNWSHAFIFGERRSDGHIWVIESDLHAARKHIRFGVQENRITKYFNEQQYGKLAILDFQLPEETVARLLSESLDLVANSTRYSVRELFGTLLALRHPTLRPKQNLLSREKSMYCSAFVQHVFCKIGVELCPGVSTKTTTPEDIFQATVPHCTYVLDRQLQGSKLKQLAGALRTRLKRNERKAGPKSE